MPRTAPAKGRHISYNADGEVCMAVVDPATRKLLIPTRYIFPTRAQHRGTLPSLCQLFLAGRCRKDQGCYQVHAECEAVRYLRSQVDSLPCCCHTHGDKDHMGVLENAPLWNFFSQNQAHAPGDARSHQCSVDATAAPQSTIHTNDIVIYVPGCSFFEGGYVPLVRVSYTNGLRRLLEEQCVLFPPSTAQVTLLNAATGTTERKIVADASGATMCRLHAMGRCRYAEECKFLHLCKNITAADPHLTDSPSTGGLSGSTDCASPNSFDSSGVNAGLTRYTDASAVSCNLCAESAHYRASVGVSVRRSIFACNCQHERQPVSLRYGGAVTADPAGAVAKGSVGAASSLQPSRSMSYHYDSSTVNADGVSGSLQGSRKLHLAGGGCGAQNKSLLVPQRECVDAGRGCADCSSAAPHLSQCSSGCRACTVGTPPMLSQRSLQVDSAIHPTMMGMSTNSFSSSAPKSSAQSATPYYCSRIGSHYRVLVGLPAIGSPPTLNLGETSICSENTISSSPERSLGLSISQNSGMSRSVSHMQTSQSSSTRWHHHPYSILCTKMYS